MSALIRVLWGSSNAPLSKWNRVWYNHIRRWRAKETNPDCQYIYVYGKDNADRLTRLGFPRVVLLNNDPWPDGQADRITGKHLVRPWYYKIEMIRQAMLDHSEIVYCDWDVCYVKQDWPYVLSRLAGRDSTFVAYGYKRSRPGKSSKSADGRIAVSGRWYHFNRIDFVETVLARMLSKDASILYWHDEIVVREILDQLNGGWMGDSKWLQYYESPITVVPPKRSPWGLSLTDDESGITRDTPIPFTWERVFV
jgi:hypothetical protein